MAIISVIIFHVANSCGDLVVAQYGLSNFNWFMTDIGKTCFRCGVDLFLMLSGALSLGRDWEIKPFLKKRIPRIAAPCLLGFLFVFVSVCNIIHAS